MKDRLERGATRWTIFQIRLKSVRAILTNPFVKEFEVHAYLTRCYSEDRRRDRAAVAAGVSGAAKGTFT
jgi:hypothetical protein